MNPANRIQYFRKSLNMSQEELGEKMFVSRQTVSQWETGQTMPSIDSLIKLREIFGVSVDELLGISAGENENAAEEESQAESYSFRFDENEVKRFYQYSVRQIKKNLLLFSLFTIGCFIIMYTSTVTEQRILYGILFGAFLVYTVMSAKIFSHTKKEWNKAIVEIPQKTYSYSVSDGVLTVKVSREGRLTSEEHKPMEEIGSITEFDGYYILVIGNRNYFIRKSDLESDSKMLLYIKSHNAVKEIPPQNIRRLKALSVSLVIASFASLFGGLITASLMAEASGDIGNFVQYMWAMFLFLPIPVCSVTLGCILKRKGIKYKKNIVVGIIIFGLLCGYGSFAFVF